MDHFNGYFVVAVAFLVLGPNPSLQQYGRGVAINGTTLRVATLLTTPFCSQNKNGQYDGFVPDVLSELEKQTGASFSLKKASDGKHGVLDKRTNIWNGVIGDVIGGDADIGFADITVTAEREKAIDFTVPFMEADLTIIYRSVLEEPVAFGWLLSAISLPFWLSILACYVIVSAVLYAIGRITPKKGKPEKDTPTDLTISDSFWATTSSVFLRGTDVPVDALSSKLLVSGWWFFSLGVVLILIVLEVSMFTSGAAFTPAAPNFFAHVGSATVGVLGGGSSHRLLLARPDLAPVLRRLEAAGSMGTPSTVAEGVQKVVDGELDGFVIESPSADIMKASHCTLETINEALDMRSFAIAVKQDSTLREVLSIELLKMRESGKLDAIRNRWWPKDRCLDFDQTTLSPARLGTYYMLFVVLFIVIAIALLAALAERYMHSKNNS